MENIKKRNGSLDLLKGFTIFLVIYCHCLQFLQPGLYLDKMPYVYIYAFHMPLFMCLTGYFSISSMSLGFKDFICKKARTLLLPAVTWGGTELIILIVIWLVLGSEISLYKVVFFFTNVYWYLKCAFICYCLYWCCNRYISRRPYYISMLLLTFILCIVIQLHNQFVDYNLIVMYMSFLIGVFIRRRVSLSDISWLHVSFIGLLFAFLLSGWGVEYCSIPNFYDTDHATFIQDYPYKVGYKILCGVSGAVFFIFFFSMMFKNVNITDSWMWKWISSVGRDTLALYCTHAILLEVFLTHFKIGKWFNEYAFDLIVAPLFTAIMIYILQLLIHRMEENKYLRYYLFGKL